MTRPRWWRRVLLCWWGGCDGTLDTRDLVGPIWHCASCGQIERCRIR